MEDSTKNKIQEIIDSSPVVLFMKGTKTFPQCGFSATVAEVLKRLEVADYRDINVLVEPELRQGIKEFSNWPTIPQLYVGGEFVGGCDIVRDMFTSGELQPIIAAAFEKKE